MYVSMYVCMYVSMYVCGAPGGGGGAAMEPPAGATAQLRVEAGHNKCMDLSSSGNVALFRAQMLAFVHQGLIRSEPEIAARDSNQHKQL